MAGAVGERGHQSPTYEAYEIGIPVLFLHKLDSGVRSKGCFDVCGFGFFSSFSSTVPFFGWTWRFWMDRSGLGWMEAGWDGWKQVGMDGVAWDCLLNSRGWMISRSGGGFVSHTKLAVFDSEFGEWGCKRNLGDLLSWEGVGCGGRTTNSR